MRDHHTSIRRNRPNGTHQLHRSDCNRALADAHRNRFSSKPFLLEVTNLPLFRRHYTAHFVGQIYPCLLSQPESGGVFCNPINTEFFRERVKENVARLINRLREIDLAMAGFNPASKTAAIESGSAIAMHVKGLGN